MLERVVRRCGWSCRAYCLLSTHYHLLFLTPEPDLAAGMQYLNGRYGQWANSRRGERGGAGGGTDLGAEAVVRYRPYPEPGTSTRASPVASGGAGA